jgi:hypothetical protein
MVSCIIYSTLLEVGLKLTIERNLESMDEALFQQLVSRLLYLTNTKLQLCFVVGLVARFMLPYKNNH